MQEIFFKSEHGAWWEVKETIPWICLNWLTNFPKSASNIRIETLKQLFPHSKWLYKESVLNVFNQMKTTTFEFNQDFCMRKHFLSPLSIIPYKTLCADTVECNLITSSCTFSCTLGKYSEVGSGYIGTLFESNDQQTHQVRIYFFFKVVWGGKGGVELNTSGKLHFQSVKHYTWP